MPIDASCAIYYTDIVTGEIPRKSEEVLKMDADARGNIERYIENTKISPKTSDAYCLNNVDMCVFYEELMRDWFHGMCMIFAYGRAKGYRAAKAGR